MTKIANIRLKSKLYYYAAHVTAVYDGDTFTVDIDLGLGIWRRGEKIRLWKVNAPEVRGDESATGKEVRDFVRGLILEKDILLRTILDKRGSDRTEKYGRLLGEVLLEGEDGAVITLNELLLDQGMGVPMDAGGSVVRAAGRPAGAAQALPAAIHCPYCGEARRVDQETATVAQCPNCLDEPFVLPRVASTHPA